MALLVAVPLVGISPAWASSPAPDPTVASALGAGDVHSVVVLGDSVAAGEGARDGYVYRDRALLPSWAAPARAARSGRACGRSSGAYGVAVAKALGAQLVNLACSGASFEQGITLDDRFDRARPDLVLVTAGANSVAFDRAFAYCVLAARGVSAAEAEPVVRSANVGDALVTALGFAARRALGDAPADTTAGCTAANPGAYLQTTVVDRATAVGAEARALAEAIRARGRRLGTVPQVVFTTYPDPLPDRAVGFAACPDGAGLGDAQLAYLHRLFTTFDDALRAALADVPGVRVADAAPAFAGHRWCDADPWVYGPSIFVTDPGSRVPFHPTPAGQGAIADAVLATLSGVPTGWNGLV